MIGGAACQLHPWLSRLRSRSPSPSYLDCLETALSLARRSLLVLTASLLLIGALCGAGPQQGTTWFWSAATIQTARAADMPAENGSVLISARTIAPTGWRRTVRGWERLETVQQKSINEWIQYQEAQEAKNPWLLAVQSLSLVHPLSFAAGQVAVACLLAAVAQPKRQPAVGQS